MDQEELVGFDLTLTEGPIESLQHQHGLQRGIHTYPTKRRLYRSIHTAKYRHRAVMRI
jgi:hypothetical protein